jgi:16S rRNA processing protein RimM
VVRISDPMIYHTGILLGRIKSIHGPDGTVAVKLERDFTEKIPEMEWVFLEIEGKPVPFFISESEYKGGEILKIRFENYYTFEKLNEFKGCRVLKDSGTGKARPAYKKLNIESFKVKLNDGSLEGTVTELIENPGQWLIKIITEEGKEILIPFHEDLIIKISRKNKIILMGLPEGLTEIN